MQILSDDQKSGLSSGTERVLSHPQGETGEAERTETCSRARFSNFSVPKNRPGSLAVT